MGISLFGGGFFGGSQSAGSSGIPYGTTQDRPANPELGQPFFNSDESRLELYTTDNGWQNIVQETPGVVSVSGVYAEQDQSSVITINGTNFSAGAIAYAVGTNGVEVQADTTTVVSVVEVTATFSGLTVANEPYDIKVVNPSNLYGILYDGLQIDKVPVFLTQSGTLGTFLEESSVSVQISATDEESSNLIFSVSSGSLPAGININSATGLISGTPADVIPNTTYSFTVSVTDGNNVVDRNFDITINDRGPSWQTDQMLSSFTKNAAYSRTVSATDDNGIQSYSLVSGSLPTGLTINSGTGEISGTPTSDTTAIFTLRATDNGGNYADRQFTIPNVGPSWITSGSITAASQNVPYSFFLNVADDAAVVSYQIISGSLPSGLVLNSVTGEISGTTSLLGSYSFSVSAEDVNGNSASQLLSILVTPPPGQASYTTPGTYTWTAPAGVTSVCVVAIGGGGRGGDSSNITSGTGGTSSFSNIVYAYGGQNGGNNASALTPGGTFVGQGGGNGGAGGRSRDWGSGGGGAGGYSGPGGEGGSGDISFFPNDTLYGRPGQGGGGAGGAGGDGQSGTYGGGGGGGGVGIFGEGTSGVVREGFRLGGGGGSGGANGSDAGVWSSQTPVPTGGLYGGGGGGTGNQGSGGGGGALAWTNNISVTPGQGYSVIVGAGAPQGSGSPYGAPGANGAVRIIWGNNRAFPSTNTQDL